MWVWSRRAFSRPKLRILQSARKQFKLVWRRTWSKRRLSRTTRVSEIHGGAYLSGSSNPESAPASRVCTCALWPAPTRSFRAPPATPTRSLLRGEPELHSINISDDRPLKLQCGCNSRRSAMASNHPSHEQRDPHFAAVAVWQRPIRRTWTHGAVRCSPTATVF